MIATQKTLQDNWQEAQIGMKQSSGNRNPCFRNYICVKIMTWELKENLAQVSKQLASKVKEVLRQVCTFQLHLPGKEDQCGTLNTDTDEIGFRCATINLGRKWKAIIVTKQETELSVYKIKANITIEMILLLL